MSYILAAAQWVPFILVAGLALLFVQRIHFHYKAIIKKREAENALVDKEPDAEWTWHASQAKNVTDIRSAIPRVTYTVILTQGADGYLAVRVADVQESEENRARIAHALRRAADLLDPSF